MADRIEQDATKKIVFDIQSGFDTRTQEPCVQVLIEAAGWVVQMPPAKARELALDLLEAAEADGFMVGFVRHVVGVTNLNEFRKYREEQSKND